MALMVLGKARPMGAHGSKGHKVRRDHSASNASRPRQNQKVTVWGRSALVRRRRRTGNVPSAVVLKRCSVTGRSGRSSTSIRLALKGVVMKAQRYMNGVTERHGVVETTENEKKLVTLVGRL